MVKYIKTTLLIGLTSLVLTSCGGSTDTTSSTVIADGVTITTNFNVTGNLALTGLGASLLPSANLSPIQSAYSTVDGFALVLSFLDPTTGDITHITYDETPPSGLQEYYIDMQHTSQSSATAILLWETTSVATQVPGFTINKATHTATFTNVTLDGSAGFNINAMPITLNGTINY